MNPPPVYQTGTNQAPIASIGKTGCYIARNDSRTIYRFPESHTLPSGQTVEGQSLAHVNTSALRRAYRSVYAPHVGVKQQAKLTAL